MPKGIGIVAIVIVAAGVGYVTYSQSNTETVCAEEICKVDLSAEQAITREESVQSEIMSEAIAPAENMVVETTPSPRVDPAVTQAASGSFEIYSAEKVAVATGATVIFFHASWCPSCRALGGDIETNKSTIPAGITILKADYDTEIELRKKYGVTTQHTLVQVDQDGTLIKKWSGGAKLESLLSQIQ